MGGELFFEKRDLIRGAQGRFNFEASRGRTRGGHCREGGVTLQPGGGIQNLRNGFSWGGQHSKFETEVWQGAVTWEISEGRQG